MNDFDNQKEIKFIILPNFNISKTFSSSAIGVFIGIFSGIIINLLVKDNWDFKDVIFLSCNIIAVILLWGAIRQNNKVKELCEDLKFKDNENKLKTVNSVLNNLWEQKGKGKNNYRYRKYKYKFYMLLYSSFIIVFLSAGFYVIHGNFQEKGTIKTKQAKVLNHTVKNQVYKKMKIDSTKNSK